MLEQRLRVMNYYQLQTEKSSSVCRLLYEDGVNVVVAISKRKDMRSFQELTVHRNHLFPIPIQSLDLVGDCGFVPKYGTQMASKPYSRAKIQTPSCVVREGFRFHIEPLTNDVLWNSGLCQSTHLGVIQFIHELQNLFIGFTNIPLMAEPAKLVSRSVQIKTEKDYSGGIKT